MKFGETHEEYKTRILREEKQAAEWKRYYALWPVKLLDGRWAWLEWVLWREIYFICRDDDGNFELYLPSFDRDEFKALDDVTEYY